MASKMKPFSKHRWTQSAILLFEHSMDDDKDYIVGIYIPAFDGRMGSDEALNQVISEYENNGDILDKCRVDEVVKNFKPQSA